MRPRTRTQHITAATTTDAKLWAKHLGCSVAELRIAIRAVGNSAESVRAYLAALSGGVMPLTGQGSEPAASEKVEACPSSTRPPAWPLGS
ncbi:DUF3606 domain-containing protein [Variovorax sp. CAN2819]|uniref:DUF3606 domain-containing protein n=1 Tax=Variovorax sp. CAN15 TaxID=3046727 RepID=UPI0026472561|nr:DUF3606 domain-containing protein [Variovorax sp. CAN15]MDN6888348.1 DUF3606 domain-containing protein [Variovorax sp. CAN15]